MTLFGLVLLGLTMGVVFGIALEKSRVFEPGMMIGQFQLRNFTMLKMFLSATVTGLVVLAALHGFELVSLHPKELVIGQTMVGGLLLGAGIAIAGACPGTVLAQLGAGYKDAWAVLAGGILGAMAYGYFEAPLVAFLKVGDYGKLTLSDTTHIPFWVLALAVAAVLILALVELEKWHAWRNDLGENLDGVYERRNPLKKRQPESRVSDHSAHHTLR